MSSRTSTDTRRRQLHFELQQLRETLDAYRPLDQEQRAELARSAQRLVHTTYDIGDRDAWQEALALDRRALDKAYPAGFLGEL